MRERKLFAKNILYGILSRLMVKNLVNRIIGSYIQSLLARATVCTGNIENTPCSWCLYISCSPISGCLYMEWPILQAGIPLSKDRTLSSACGGVFHFYTWGRTGLRFYKYIYYLIILNILIYFHPIFKKL